MAEKNLDLVSRLSPEQETEQRLSLKSISPDDGKYKSSKLLLYLTPEAEWRTCAFIQKVLLQHCRQEAYLIL